MQQHWVLIYDLVIVLIVGLKIELNSLWKENAKGQILIVNNNTKQFAYYINRFMKHFYLFC